MQIVTADMKDKKPGLIINVVIDGSGLMASNTEQVISSFNEFVKTQKESHEDQRVGQVYLTLTIFRTEYKTAIQSALRKGQYQGQHQENRIDVLYACKPIEEVPMLTTKEYIADGGTPLNDAVGMTVNAVDNATKEWEQPPAIMTVIITDGAENTSKEFTASNLAKIIQDKESKGWQFIYLGEGLAAIEQASSMGFTKGVKRMRASNMVGTMRAVSESATSYCCALQDAGSFGDLAKMDLTLGTADALYEKAADGDDLSTEKKDAKKEKAKS